ncbi:MAG: glycoside hydrolase TIM-barrel-like domain-containing protein, partial [Pseudomonadota bacterium]
ASGEPWVFRYKDLKNWWSNAHHDRPAGVRAASPTAWVPQSKPVWLMEAGAPALDKGANQPNVFIDPKSSESAAPYYSSATRDDLMQRRYLEALLAVFSDAAANPVSGVYGGPMVPIDRICAYCYDARSFPDFPGRLDVWSDGPNWATGHWLNGRLERISLGSLVEALAGADMDAAALETLVTGYVLSDPVSPRAAIEALAAVYRFDVVARDGELIARPREAKVDLDLVEDDLADADETRVERVRIDPADLPDRMRLSFLDDGAEQRPGVAEAFAAEGGTGRAVDVEAPIVMDAGEAQARAKSLLAETEGAREAATFSLPPDRLEVEPGDVLRLTYEGRERRLRVLAIESAEARRLETLEISEEADIVRPAPIASFSLSPAVAPFGPPVGAVLDLPLLRDDGDPDAVYAAALAEPWPGAVSVRRGVSGPIAGRLTVPTTVGALTAALPVGPVGLWTGDALEVEAFNAGFLSRPRAEVLDGANALAVRSAAGGWEIVQFETATLVGTHRWRLEGLLRGLRGTAPGAADEGAAVVALGTSLGRLDLRPEFFGVEIDWEMHPEAQAGDAVSRTILRETVEGVGRRPYAPAHLRVAADGADYAVSWIR